MVSLKPNIESGRRSKMAEPLRDWDDWRLAQELRFRLRFEQAGTNAPIDMHSQILCEAVARILERLPAITEGTK